jgi:hypothetical protein
MPREEDGIAYIVGSADVRRDVEIACFAYSPARIQLPTIALTVSLSIRFNLLFVALLIAPPVRDLFEGLGSICKNSYLVRHRLIALDDNVDVEWVEFNSAAHPPCILGSN